MNILDSIPWGLFEHYVSVIKYMGEFRGTNIYIYTELEKKRVSLHDDILEFCGKTREDKDFTYALAILVEQFLNKEVL
jgi:hypothetical protein